MKNTPLTPKGYLDLVTETFQAHANPEVATGQSKYMRNLFPFYGLKMPVWKGLARDLFGKHGGFSDDRLALFARMCFTERHREVHYFAIEMVQRGLKWQDEHFIQCLEDLITTRSWWDSVDWLAKLTGRHFRRFPGLQYPVCEEWITSGNIWLQRVTMIHQLHWKEETDVGLMFAMILHTRDSKEFFLQKGAGWALREYSKTDAQAVIEFIEHHDLAPLTKREGLKWLKNKGLI